MFGPEKQIHLYGSHETIREVIISPEEKLCTRDRCEGLRAYAHRHSD